MKRLQKLPKIIVVIGFEKLPKVQKIAQSGHTDSGATIETPKTEGANDVGNTP